jgi:hypothetical protein
MRFSLWLLALIAGTLSAGVFSIGCSDDATHVTYLGPIDASPVPPRLGRPDAGAD